MKKLLLVPIVFLIVSLVSCVYNPSPRERPIQNVITNEKNLEDHGYSINIRYFVVEIDGCEYIATRTYHGYYSLTHKGNCKYCAQRKSNFSYMDSTSF